MTVDGTLPTTSRYNYASVSWGFIATEEVKVQRGDAVIATNCVPKWTLGQPCPMIIGVLGSRPGNYTAVVELATSTGNDVVSVGVTSPVVAPFDAAGNVTLAVWINDPAASGVSLSITGFDVPIQVLWGSSARGGRPVAGNSSSYCQLWQYSTLNSNVFHASNSSRDPCWCGGNPTNCIYYATVSAVPGVYSSFDGTAYAQAYYTYPNGSNPGAGGWFQLVDGVPVSGGTTYQGEYAYFTFLANSWALPAEGGEVIITLTPTLGDADLFVTLDGSIPSSSNWNYQSVRGSGADMVTISRGDRPFAQYCAPSLGVNATCLIRIAAHGWSIESAFIISATLSRYTTLLPNNPSAGSLAAGGELRYYRYQAYVSGDPITFSLTATSGTPWVFVGCDGPGGGSSRPDPSNTSTYVWRTSVAGGPLVLIPGVTPGACVPPRCTFYLTVAGGPVGGPGAGSAGFSLLGSPGGPNITLPSLPINVPIYGSAPPDAFDRYVLRWPAPDVTTVVVAADATAGWPWLLGGFLAGRGLTFANADYTSYNYGPVFSRIQVDAWTPGGAYLTKCANWNGSWWPQLGEGEDEIGDSSSGASTAANIPAGVGQSGGSNSGSVGSGAPLLPGPPGCPLTVALYGASDAATRYVITAFTTSEQLPEGQPIEGVVEPSGYSRFIYTAVDRTPFTIALSPTSGDPDLLMAAKGGDATTSNYQWSSTTSGAATEMVSVTWQEPVWATINVTFPFDFYIGVFGWDGPAAFFITAVSSSAIQLVEGVPTAATLKAGQLTYFSYYLPIPNGGGSSSASDPGWSLDLVPLSGPPSGAAQGGVAVWISNQLDTTYNLTLWPQCRSVPCNPNLTPAPVSPFGWTSNTGAASTIGVSVDVLSTDGGFRAGATYIAAVFSPVATTVAVTGTGLGNTQLLQSGIPVPLTLPPSSYRYYQLLFYPTPAANLSYLDVYVSLTTASGDGNLYASSTWANRRPSPLRYDFASTASGLLPDSLYIPGTNFTCLGSGGGSSGRQLECAAFIAVYAPSSSILNVTTAATITATVVNNSGFSPTLLSPGQPATGAVPPGGMVYFTAFASQLTSPLTSWTVSMTPTAGNPDVYVRIGKVPGTLNGTYDWSSTTSGVDSISVWPGEPGFCANCTINVAVVASASANGANSSSSFALWFSYATTPITLLPGIQYGEGRMQPSQPRYLVLPVADPAADVSLSLATNTFPSPQWYLSPWAGGGNNASVPMPLPGSGGSATACRQLQGSGTMVVRSSAAFGDRCYCSGCSYVIGLYCGLAAQSGCAFTATGSTDSPLQVIPLAEGVPVQGYAPPWSYAYYTFNYGVYGPQPVRNISVSAVPAYGAPVLFATNRFLRGSSTDDALPSNETDGFIWTSGAAGQSAGGSPAITIPAGDGNITGCAACSDVTVAAWGGETGSSFSISALTDSDLPRLTLQLPSGTYRLQHMAQQAFEFLLPNPTAGDLLVTISLYSGSGALLLLDPTRAGATCGSPLGRGQLSPNCAPVWITNRTVIRVPAAAPCSSNATKPGLPCDPTRVWRAGLYYVNVYAWAQDVSFSVLVSQLGPDGQLTTLLAGQPVTAYTTSSPPIVFSYTTPPDVNEPTVRFMVLWVSGPALNLFFSSCTAYACTPDHALPGPEHPNVTSIADAVAQRQVSNIVIESLSHAFCRTGGRDPCTYYLRVEPQCTGPGGSCSGGQRSYFQVYALTEDGTTPIIVTEQSVRANAISRQEGSVSLSALGRKQTYEVYTGAAASSGPVPVSLLLESGGPVYARAYACDPLLPTSPCSQPYAPSPASYNYLLDSSASGNGTGWLFFLTSSPVVSVSVFFDGPPTPNGTSPINGAGPDDVGGNHSLVLVSPSVRPAAVNHLGSADEEVEDGASSNVGSHGLRGGGSDHGHRHAAADGIDDAKRRGLQGGGGVEPPPATYRLYISAGATPLFPSQPPVPTTYSDEPEAPGAVTVTVLLQPPVMLLVDALASAAAGAGRVPVLRPLPSPSPGQMAYPQVTYSIYAVPFGFNAAQYPWPRGYYPATPSGVARWTEATWRQPLQVDHIHTNNAVAIGLPNPFPEATYMEFQLVVSRQEVHLTSCGWMDGGIRYL